MNKRVTLWNEIYSNFHNQQASGESESTLLKKTHLEFEYDMLRPFRFLNVWDVVKKVLSGGPLQKWTKCPNLQKEAKLVSIRPHKKCHKLSISILTLTLKKYKCLKAKIIRKTISSDSSMGTWLSNQSNRMVSQMAQLSQTLDKHVIETSRNNIVNARRE